MQHVLTLIARDGLSHALIARARDAVAGGRPDVLAADEAVDIPCPAVIDLTEVLAGHAVDWAILPAANRRKRLLIADMDSTIVTSETLDELAAHAGVGAAVAAITRRSMAGAIDFATALRERVAMLRGLSVGALDATWAGTALMPGAIELIRTMRANGAVTALVSGGFTWFTGRVAQQVGFDRHHANTLHHDGTTLTGTVAEPILDRDAKRTTLLALAAEHGLTPDDALAVGDGANDLAMIQSAGLGVAYHAKPITAAAARVRIDHCNLRALLFLQGYRAAEIVA